MIKDIDKLLPLSGVKYFNDVYNKALSNGSSEGVALGVAWSAVKNKLVVQGGSLVAMSDNFETPTLFSFKMSQPEINVVMNSETEEIILDAILADTTPNTEGKFFTDEELQSISEQINVMGSTLPDVDHEKLNSLVKKFGNNYDAIVAELKKEKGIFKNIKATFEKGKLWIQAVLDKRYKNHTEKFKSLSIEALAKSDDNGRLRNPKYLGFTFTNNPKLKAARIAI
jgi:hypothetical protein